MGDVLCCVCRRIRAMMVGGACPGFCPMCWVVYAGACVARWLDVLLGLLMVGSVGFRMPWLAGGDGLAGPAMVGRVLCRVAYVGTCADFPMIVPNAGL